MVITIFEDGVAQRVECPEDTTVWTPSGGWLERVGEIMGTEAIDECPQLLKVPDATGGYHRLPTPFALEMARAGKFGLVLRTHQLHRTEAKDG